jgi:hypothetical protein
LRAGSEQAVSSQQRSDLRKTAAGQDGSLFNHLVNVVTGGEAEPGGELRPLLSAEPDGERRP